MWAARRGPWRSMSARWAPPLERMFHKGFERIRAVVDQGWNIVGRNDAALRLRHAFLDEASFAFAAVGRLRRSAARQMNDHLSISSSRYPRKPRLGGGRPHAECPFSVPVPVAASGRDCQFASALGS
jgi:hypothetical protein